MTLTLEASVKRLESLAELEQDWNSYGALPIEPGVIARALEALRGLTGPLPYICPTPTGGVNFEWPEVASRGLEVEFLARGGSEFLAEDGDTALVDEVMRDGARSLAGLARWLETGEGYP